MKCLRCGSEAGNAKFCPECGAPMMVAPPQQVPPPLNSGRSNVPPLPPPQIQPAPKKKKGGIKTGLLIAGAIFVGAAVLGGLGQAFGKTDDSSSTPVSSTVQSTAVPAASSAISSSAPEVTAIDVYLEYEMTAEQAQAIDDVVQRQIKLSNNKNSSNVPTQIVQGDLTAGNTYNYYITFENKQTYSVLFSDNAIQTMEDKNGLFLYQEGVENPHYFSYDAVDFSFTKNTAKTHIESILVSPASAEWPGSFLSPFEGWSFGVAEGKYLAVQSYVDSQNRMGALLRSNFTIYYELTVAENGATNYKAVYVVFDDEVVLDDR